MSEEPQQPSILPAYYYFYSHLGQYLSRNAPLGWPYWTTSYAASESLNTDNVILEKRREKKKSFLIDDLLAASDKEEEREEDGEEYSWLQCTRYKPPRVPRSPKKEGSSGKKRKLGRNPRVPFTQHQVSTLEQKFRRTHYLSSLDVAELSAGLNLTETRVKIWFQNRRARERREREHVRPNITPGSPVPPPVSDAWLGDDINMIDRKFSPEPKFEAKFSPEPKPYFLQTERPPTSMTSLTPDLNSQWIPTTRDENHT